MQLVFDQSNLKDMIEKEYKWKFPNHDFLITINDMGVVASLIPYDPAVVNDIRGLMYNEDVIRMEVNNEAD